MNDTVWAHRGVLVLGARGMLGHALMATLYRDVAGQHRERITGWDIEELDIRRADQVREAFHRLRPSAVINAAAYTDVDGCETNVDEAMAVNAKAPGHIARACAELDAICIHMGTDFVFEGMSDRPYQSDDEVRPLSVYGRSKWEGEQAVRGAACEHLIVRTSWLFGLHGRNFVETIIEQGRAGGPLRVVTDQIGRPTLTSDLGDALVRLLNAKARGTIHFANAGQCSWFEFAREIVRQSGLEVPVEPICSIGLDRPARRPMYSVLDTRKYTELTGHVPPSWQHALSQYLVARENMALSQAEPTARPARASDA